jgi:hypothetical protein
VECVSRCGDAWAAGLEPTRAQLSDGGECLAGARRDSVRRGATGWCIAMGVHCGCGAGAVGTWRAIDRVDFGGAFVRVLAGG